VLPKDMDVQETVITETYAFHEVGYVNNSLLSLIYDISGSLVSAELNV